MKNETAKQNFRSIRNMFAAAATALLGACAITPPSNVTHSPNPEEYKTVFAGRVQAAQEQADAAVGEAHRKVFNNVTGALRTRAAKPAATCAEQYLANLGSLKYYEKYEKADNDANPVYNAGHAYRIMGGMPNLQLMNTICNEMRSDDIAVAQKPVQDRPRKHPLVQIKKKPAFVGPPLPADWAEKQQAEEFAQQHAMGAPQAANANTKPSVASKIHGAGKNAVANTKQALTWNNIKSAAPKMALGMGVSVGIKSLFAAAATAATAPAWATGLIGFAGLAVAGGAVSAINAALANRKSETKRSVGKAFAKGAAFAVGFGLVGGAAFGVLHSAISPNGLLHTIFEHTTKVGDTLNMTPVNNGVASPFAATHAASAAHAAHAPAAPVAPHIASHAQAAHTAAPHSPAAHAPAHHAAAHHPAHVQVETLYVSKPSLLSDDLMKTLPKNVQHLASSHDPKTLVHFCKEAETRLLQHHLYDPKAQEAAKSLIEKGLDIAQKAGIDSDTTFQLTRDMKIVKSLGMLVMQPT